MKAEILPAGESCLFVDFGEKISRENNTRVQAVRLALEKEPFVGMRELVPTYRSLSVYFDPLTTDLAALKERLRREADAPVCADQSAAVTVRVPALFGGEMGPDLPDVAAHTGLSEEEVVRRYCASPLYCYMNGFTPGYPYLGGMDPSLATPRLKTPRQLVPANSVAIGGAQAGAYTIASPGGWRIIGRVPYNLYDPAREPAVAIRSGMNVKFYPVNMSRFMEIQALAAHGRYRIEYEEGENRQ
ncbi:MAG: 5-oxoprolinase subunit PxpB [Pyramidobacter sp.]